MSKKYYIMALNEDSDCPTGFYYSVLAKDFEEIEGDYGRNPWYAGPKRYGGTLPSLPDELILMEENNYRYDVRKGSSYFYIISDKFEKCLSKIKHNFTEASLERWLNCYTFKKFAYSFRALSAV